jgi:hypothetical protein
VTSFSSPQRIPFLDRFLAARITLAQCYIPEHPRRLYARMHRRSQQCFQKVSKSRWGCAGWWTICSSSSRKLQDMPHNYHGYITTDVLRECYLDHRRTDKENHIMLSVVVDARRRKKLQRTKNPSRPRCFRLKRAATTCAYPSVSGRKNSRISTWKPW